MSLQYTSAGHHARAEQRVAVDSRLRGRQLLVIRTIWATLVALAQLLFVIALPARFLRLSAPPAEVHDALDQLGLTVGFYTAYYLGTGVIFSLCCFALAWIIARRKSDNRMALLASLYLVLLGAVYGPNSSAVELLHPALVFPARFAFFLLMALLTLFAFVFPDGRFVPPWSRFLSLLLIGWLALAILLPGPPLDDGPGLVGALMLLAIVVSGTACQVYRFRRVSTPEQRQQTKWAVAGVIASMAGFLGFIALPDVLFPAIGASDSRGLVIRMITEAGALVSSLLLPVAIGMAILRYRLWDIDLIINRALVYTGLTAGVIGIYVLVVGYLGALFQAGSTLAISLIATGVVAVLFQPLRERLQRGVNRVMYGDRDDPYAVISRLGRRLEGTLAPDAVLSTIVETVRESLRLPYVAVALRQSDTSVITVAAGDAIASAPARSPESEPLAQRVSIPLTFNNEPVGELLLAPRSPGELLSPTDRRLLEDLARQAGVAVHAMRLTADLQRLSMDLQRSRERLIAAREEERRRLRRDLHDGLGPQLASMTLKVDAARDELANDVAGAAALLQGLKHDIQSAIADVRRLVYGLRPPALDELGLVAALRVQIAHYQQQLSVQFDAPEELPVLPAAVEVAVYRIIIEALANIVRHAAARSCMISIRLEDARLELEVQDDGRSLRPDYQAGVGMQSMRERAAELGGACMIESLPEGGTRVRASLPLES